MPGRIVGPIPGQIVGRMLGRIVGRMSGARRSIAAEMPRPRVYDPMYDPTRDACGPIRDSGVSSASALTGVAVALAAATLTCAD